MEICLRYLAYPGFQNGVGEVVGVSQATVSRTVKFVVESICHKANIYGSSFQQPLKKLTLQLNIGKLQNGFHSVSGPLTVL